MAPPTDKPRLSNLDPDVVAEQAHELAMEHLRGIAYCTGTELKTGGESFLRADMADLVRYAQTGSLGEWRRDEQVLDALQTIHECLFSQAGAPYLLTAGPLAESEGAQLAALDEALAYANSDAIGVVMLAAHGRFRVAVGGTVTARELGALADLSVRMIQQLVGTGELRALAGGARPFRFSAKTADRWLSGRGVPGFGKLTKQPAGDRSGASRAP